LKAFFVVLAALLNIALAGAGVFFGIYGGVEFIANLTVFFLIAGSVITVAGVLFKLKDNTNNSVSAFIRFFGGLLVVFALVAAGYFTTGAFYLTKLIFAAHAYLMAARERAIAKILAQRIRSTYAMFREQVEKARQAQEELNKAPFQGPSIVMPNNGAVN
jgi:small-conductance mechanosensitive channel